MTWSPIYRAVTFARRRRSHEARTVEIASVQVRRQVSAMGLEVQPVHGRHCICERCERQAGLPR